VKSIQSPSLTTFSHLSGKNEPVTEYELLTSQLLYHPSRGFSVDVPARRWYAKYTEGSRISSPNWEEFQDPDELTYSKYVKGRNAQHQIIEGILVQLEQTSFDTQLSDDALYRLAHAVYPLRYPIHALQMQAAYIGHLAPSGRISVAALFQAADELARIHCIASRMSVSVKVHREFDWDSRTLWQTHAGWQPLRELIERLLVCYDWGEAFVALNLCIKPVFDSLMMIHAPRAIALDALASLFFPLEAETRWHRRWSAALVQMLIAQRRENLGLFESWIDAWLPPTLQAIFVYANAFTGEEAAALAQADVMRYLSDTGLPFESRIR
jgi:hypothetical protein